MKKKLIKRIVLYCPNSTHNSTTFYSHIHIYIHKLHTLKLTRWLPHHTTRRLLSTTLRATSEGSMTKLGLAIADKSVLTRGGTKVHCLKQACLAANFGLGNSPTPRLVNHETEQRGPCRGEQRCGSQRVN
jgi:hypothetical protein